MTAALLALGATFSFSAAYDVLRRRARPGIPGFPADWRNQS